MKWNVGSPTLNGYEMKINEINFSLMTVKWFTTGLAPITSGCWSQYTLPSPSLLSRVSQENEKRPFTLVCLGRTPDLSDFSRGCVQRFGETPDDLHLPLTRLCSQLSEPPHGLHLLLSRLCSQICEPPNDLHLIFSRLSSQIWEPPHGL
jgi:hypothetical protein